MPARKGVWELRSGSRRGKGGYEIKKLGSTAGKGENVGDYKSGKDETGEKGRSGGEGRLRELPAGKENIWGQGDIYMPQ